jgi:hypothetical protein
MTKHVSTFLLRLAPLACLTACSAEAPAVTTTTQHVGCDGENESYVDENGEEVLCIYTEEPGDPPLDPCLYFPEICNPPDPPDPPDPCQTNPDSCGGGDPTPPVCSTVDNVPANFPQLVDQKVESCFTQNWSSTPFNEQTNTTGWYNPGQGGWTYSVADWLSANVTSCVVSGIDWIFYSGSQADQVMQNLITRLNTQANEEGLTPHQKICSALCVSGKLINYSTQNITNALPSGAVTSGIGVCREFALIGERLLDGMGFSSSVAFNSAQSHAFVEVTSPGGGTFYVEPQTSDCVFYNRH